MTQLRDRAKQSTENIHRYVEQAPIMKAIMSGQVQESDYLQYLVEIRDIYWMLENRLTATHLRDSMGVVGMTAKIQRDIDQLTRKAEVSTEPQCRLPCQSYLEYLNSIVPNSDQNLTRIMAHVYIRVLADLSGGQMLRERLVQLGYPVESYDINDQQATVRNQIISWINLQATDANAFIGECHIAFLSYAAILKA
jgi:heme oxygenase